MIQIPTSLTCLPRKREIYVTDPYFRDAWEDMLALWGAEGAAGRLFNLAPVIFRPDALVVRGVERALKATRALGFLPITHSTFRYDRHSVREGWRYQLNVATRDRIDVMDMIMPATDSLYVLTRRVSTKTGVPATTYLSSQKGPSLPEHRQPHHLRALIGKVQVSALTYVHISDEPADIVRDLGIFFDRPRRLEILRSVEEGADAGHAVDDTVLNLYGSVQAHTLDFIEALDRIAHTVRRHYPSSARAECSVCPELLGLCEAVRNGDSRDWRRLLALADAAHISVDHWDLVAIAATLAERHLDNDETVIPDISALDWRSAREPR